MAGLLLAAYGALELWVGRMEASAPARQRVCTAWLCPDEWSDAQVAELKRLSAGQYSEFALQRLKRALSADSADAFRWADVGEAEMNAHDPSAAAYCFRRALSAAPGQPEILTRAANFSFLSGDDEGTFRNLSTILRDPGLTEYYEPAFETYSRLGLPTSEVVARGIPPNSGAAAAYLRYCMRGKSLDEAEEIWKALPAHVRGDDKLAGEYISFLLGMQRYGVAADTWKSLNPQADLYKTNFVFNGNFEHEPKPSPFDWTVGSDSDVFAERAPTITYEGDWSLRLTFMGRENVDYHKTFQLIAIKPGRWLLRAYVKTEALTTDKGVVLRVYDPENPQRLDARTESYSGTNTWTEVIKSFETGPATKLIRLEFMREPSLNMDNRISGMAWLDAVQLNPGH